MTVSPSNPQDMPPNPKADLANRPHHHHHGHGTGKHVAVVMGGWSAERDVSLDSGRGVVDALISKGYRVTPIDLQRDMGALVAALTPPPDVVFLGALHGRWGEDGCIQGLLEMMGIPYTNSGVLASALGMHKPSALDILRRSGLTCPDGRVYDWASLVRGDVPFPPLPFVVKPIQEGSSVGVQLVLTPSALKDLMGTPWTFGDGVLIEPYIQGREIQVAVLGGNPLGAIEIRPKNAFYDYDAKYTDGRADHIMPADLDPPCYARALQIGKQAHDALGCQGLSRVDMIYDGSDFYVLEVNTQPGMTPLSLAPEIAAHGGMSFADLCSWMVENPRCPD